MSQRLAPIELVCIAGIFVWTIGELHTYVETQTILSLTSGDPSSINQLMTQRTEIVSLRKALTHAITNEGDEFTSRHTLQSLQHQAGLSPLDLPELARLLNPSTALPLQVLIHKRNEMIHALPSIPPAEGWISSGFGDRLDPMNRTKADHKGLDISNNDGTVIRAPSDGIVRYSGKYGRFGYYISVVHGFGIVTKFAHLKEVRVKAGQPVKRGDIIALMGSSGKSTGTHLHYEVWVNDKPFNPYAFIPKVMAPTTRFVTTEHNPDNLPLRQTIEIAASH